MKIVIAGSTGLLGEAVVAYFQNKGDEVHRLVRPRSTVKEGIPWNVRTKSIAKEKLEGTDAVIHLGGVSIAGSRWTTEYKNEIKKSRIDSTRFLAQTLAELQVKPKVFMCASAVGIYGACDSSKRCTEESPVGNDFLADVCHQWEQATEAAQGAGIRTVSLRIGVVLSKKGGAIKQMWLPFQLGLGGVLGTGNQIYSWIALDEIPSIMDFVIHSDLKGAVNVTAPKPVSNLDFTKALGRAIGRPTLLPVPAFGARLLFGEMADALLLNGAYVEPKRLLKAGYTFKYPDIESGLRAALS